MSEPPLFRHTYPPRGEVDEMMLRLGKLITRYGWAIQGVFPDKVGQGVPYTYTVGLTEACCPSSS